MAGGTEALDGMLASMVERGGKDAEAAVALARMMDIQMATTGLLVGLSG